MARKGGRYFNKQLQNNETNDKATKNLIEGTPNNGDANRTACAGLIFMCDESTKIDCFKYRVLGLSEKKKNLMDMITKGMCLFLFDVNSKLLYGIYAASSFGAFMLEPDAFGGNYPWQVKFHIEKDCLPLQEDVFKAAIKDNYFARKKFKAQLNAEQVQNLVSLFSPLPGGLVQHYNPPRLTYEANEAVGLIQSDALLKLNHTPAQPLTDAVMSDTCMHGCHPPGAKHGFPPPAPTCEGKGTEKFIQSNPFSSLNHEPAHPSNDSVTTEKFMHGYHAPQAKHDSPPPTLTNEANKANEFTPLPRLNYEPTKMCMHGYHAPTAKNGFLPPMLTCEANKADPSIQSAPFLRKNHECNDAVITKKCMHDYHAATANHGFLPPILACEVNKADGIIQSAPLLRLNYEHMHPIDKPAMIEKGMHGYHARTGKHGFVPLTLTCEANKPDGLMQSALPKLNHEPKYPLNEVVMAEKCMHNCLTPTAKHEHKCAAARVERDAYMSLVIGNSPIHRHNHADLLSGPLYALRATSEWQNTGPNQIRTVAELYPGGSASYVNSSVVRKGYLMPNAVHAILFESKLHEGQPMGLSSSVCSHAKMAPREQRVFNALPGHDPTENLHKRPFQDTSPYALSDAVRSVLDTSGERPLKCMHHEVIRRPSDDTFAGAVDGVPPNVCSASLLHGGIGCGW